MGLGPRVWLVFAGIYASIMLVALEFTTVSTALPTIVNDLKDSKNFVWVGAAYTLATTAVQPLLGSMADIFGRRSIMLMSLAVFAAGSAVCGAAHNMPMLIAGRSVKGIGAAGITSVSDIIVADLVPLKDRGAYMGSLAAVWAVASAVGPIIGGILSQKSSWRWLFYINLPLTGFAYAMVFFFMTFKSPNDRSIRHKLLEIDWLGNAIVVVGTTATVIALTWGGVTFPWSSFHVLLPLVLGVTSMSFFIYYEKRWAKNPSVPWEYMSNLTSLSGYLGTLFHGVVASAIVYYLPTYFQAVKGNAPLKAGINMLEVSLIIASCAITSAIIVTILKRYRLVNYLGWVLITVGFGTLSLIGSNSARSMLAILQIPAAIGVGMIYGTVEYPVMAPLALGDNARALALIFFVRTFANTFGIVIGSSVLQNELTRRLPAEFLTLFPPNQSMAYAAIDIIPKLSAEEQALVKTHIANSMSLMWKVFTGISGAGLLSCLLMKELPMASEVDTKWQLENKEPETSSDLESGVTPSEPKTLSSNPPLST